MASFGKVLDLLDDRYLNLQDVAGNVEPLPTLVPYEQYMQNVLVYRIDTNHELFMGLIQDFTARMSQQLGKELWTWCVQWGVEDSGTGRLNASASSPKKPRLKVDQPAAGPNEQQPQRKKPIIDVFDRRVLDPELTKEEDMLRILIDIVQVDSTIVPNFIEFLYRWIDYYEGDGKALKAALKWEIPSLWDFDYHPLVLPADVRRSIEQDKAKQGKENVTEKDKQSGQTGKPATTSSAQELAQGSPTKKMREKPNLSALERQTEESERLQYREVKFGIQPPKLHQPLPPLINIPRDPGRRVKYYAACFKSRQRALVLLLEAGISMQQISNYQKLQEGHPRDTPEDGDPKELKGLRHYHKDAGAAQEYFAIREKLQQRREKHKEIAISSKLAIEAQIAAASGVPDGASGIPLIPPTPSYPRPPNMAADMLTRIRAAKGKGEERINFIPTPLVGRMKSKLFEGAKDRRLMQGTARPGGHLPRGQIHSSQGTEDDGDHDSDMDDSSEDEDHDMSGQTTSLPIHTVTAPRPSAQQHNSSNMAGPNATTATPTQSARGSPAIVAYIRDLNPEQAQRLLPLLNHGLRETLGASIAPQVLGHQVPVPDNATGGPAGNGYESIRPSIDHAGSSDTSHTAGSDNAGVAPGSDQHRSASTPSLAPPVRPPIIAVAPGQHRPTLPFLTSPARAQTMPLGSALGSITQIHSQRSIGFQSHNQLSGSSNIPHTSFSPVQGMQQKSDELGGVQGTPQIARPPQGTLPPPSTSQQPRLSTLPHATSQNLHSTLSMVTSQGSIYANHAAPSHASQSLRTGPNPCLPQQHPHLQLPKPHQSPDKEALPNLPQQLSSAAAFQSLPQQGDPQKLPQQLSQSTLQALPRPTSPSIMVTEPQSQLIQPSPHLPTISPPRPGIQRNAPSPLTLMPPPPPSPFSSLAPSLLATTPFAASVHSIPIQIYLPKVVVPGNGIGPGGAKLGDNGSIETDAFLVGHTRPGSGKMVLSKAIFMPVGVWTNTLNRVRKGAYQVLETYPAPSAKEKAPVYTSDLTANPHRAVYVKLAQAYSLMRSSKNREDELTKRWRATPGPMTQEDRGAVWEGWGVTLDMGIEMAAEERKGALISSWLVDEGVDKKRDEAAEKRRKEMEELMEEEEGDDYDDMDED